MRLFDSNSLILPMEDGISAARTLPIDLRLAKLEIETATFGFG